MLHWEWPVMPGSINLSHSSLRYPHGINSAEGQEDGKGCLHNICRWTADLWCTGRIPKYASEFQQIGKKSRTAKHFKHSEVMHWFTMPASFSLLCRVASVDDYKENILKWVIQLKTEIWSVSKQRFNKKTTHLYQSDSFENAQMCQASH